MYGSVNVMTGVAGVAGGCDTPEATMNDRILRTFIQQQIATGLLPTDRSLRAWLGTGDGTLCHACGEVLGRQASMIEGFTAAGTVFRFHTRCFYIWANEREARLAVAG